MGPRLTNWNQPLRDHLKEKAGDAGEDRKRLVKMMKKLRKGDLVVVTRTDLLAPSIFQMFRIVSQQHDD